mmetsp:Transcript_108504/g.305819  ORF Transcript_108504/g.305819 Transcript_108504/m.305819 type:complete len:334 (+) Transcript_108504:808-1809(+)
MAMEALVAVRASLRLPEPGAGAAAACAVETRAQGRQEDRHWGVGYCRGMERRCRHRRHVVRGWIGKRQGQWLGKMLRLLLNILLIAHRIPLEHLLQRGRLHLFPQLDLADVAQMAMPALFAVGTPLRLVEPCARPALSGTVQAGADRRQRGGIIRTGWLPVRNLGQPQSRRWSEVSVVLVLKSRRGLDRWLGLGTERRVADDHCTLLDVGRAFHGGDLHFFARSDRALWAQMAMPAVLAVHAALLLVKPSARSAPAHGMKRGADGRQANFASGEDRRRIGVWSASPRFFTESTLARIVADGALNRLVFRLVADGRHIVHSPRRVVRPRAEVGR